MNAKLRLLAICPSYPPDITPSSVRVSRTLAALKGKCEVAVVTVGPGRRERAAGVYEAPFNAPSNWLSVFQLPAFRKMKSWLVWPDEYIFWCDSAFQVAADTARKFRPDIIGAFMLPYSVGNVGLRLKKKLGLPLALTFSDSLTCPDMSGIYPSLFHFHLARRYEDRLINGADLITHISASTVDRLKLRLPKNVGSKVRVLRGGAEQYVRGKVNSGWPFRIAYTGGMNGWHSFGTERNDLPRRALRAFDRLGQYEIAPLDFRSSSPVFLGLAAKELMQLRPELKDRVRIEIYGNTFLPASVDAVLDKLELHDIVQVHGPRSNDDVRSILTEVDALFLTLPMFRDNRRSCRMSLKTYEYLATDRPIIAALPEGETREFMRDYPGVFFAAPDDVDGLRRILEQLIVGRATSRATYDREENFQSLSYRSRADEYFEMLSEIAAPVGAT